MLIQQNELLLFYPQVISPTVVLLTMIVSDMTCGQNVWLPIKQWVLWS